MLYNNNRKNLFQLLYLRRGSFWQKPTAGAEQVMGKDVTTELEPKDIVLLLLTCHYSLNAWNSQGSF